MAHHFQDYESFRLVVNEALGGTTSQQEANDSEAIGTFEELAAAFQSIGGTIG